MANNYWLNSLGGAFEVGTNWSSGLPWLTDTCIIDAPGTYTVTLNSSQSLRRLKLYGTTTFDIQSGELDLTGDNAQLLVESEASVILSRGILSVGEGRIDGLLDSRYGGTLWGSGHVSGAGTIALGGGTIVRIPQGTAFGFDGLMAGSGRFFSMDIGKGGVGILHSTGTLRADDPDNPLVVSLALNGKKGHVNLLGVAEATSGAGLVFDDSSVVFLGVLQAVGAGSHVDLQDAWLFGSGRLDTEDGGIIQTLASGVTVLGSGITNAGHIRVNDGTSLALFRSIVNEGEIGLAAGTAETTLFLYGGADVDLPDTSDNREVTLAGGGVVLFSDSDLNRIVATSAKAKLTNQDNTISGAGQLGTGSFTLVNRGTIDATGTHALVVDVGSRHLTNAGDGVVRASGTGGLFFDAGTLKNTATVAVTDGSSFALDSDATLDNNDGGTLSKGRWEVTDAGSGASMILAGTAIASLAATVVLSGVYSHVATGAVALEDSLSSVAASGRLELLGGRDWLGTISFGNDGRIDLAGGAFEVASLTQGGSALLRGFGTIAAPLHNDGKVEARGGTIEIAGAVAGAGILQIDGSATLRIDGGVSGDQHVLFNGKHAVLALGDPTGFAGTIDGWSVRDTIDLRNTQATSAVIEGGFLHVELAAGGALDYAVTGSFDNTRLQLTDDLSGGTNITLLPA